MIAEEKKLILGKAKQFFRDKIIQNHQEKTLKLKTLDSFTLSSYRFL